MPTDSIWKTELDEEGFLPPCQYYISVERPECAIPAPWAALVRTQVASAVVYLCDEHKEEYERKSIARRRRLAAEERHQRRQSSIKQ